MFYSYAYPESAGFAQAAARPVAARYSAELRGFVLPYETVPVPDLQTTRCWSSCRAPSKPPQALMDGKARLAARKLVPVLRCSRLGCISSKSLALLKISND
jgi:hypothetical protein